MTCENCGACTYSNEEYQEFIPYKEYAIGEFFKVGNKVFKVIEESKDYPCEDCDLGDSMWCHHVACTAQGRDDLTEVAFILYDTLEYNE